MTQDIEFHLHQDCFWCKIKKMHTLGMLGCTVGSLLIGYVFAMIIALIGHLACVFAGMGDIWGGGDNVTNKERNMILHFLFVAILVWFSWAFINTGICTLLK
jgi:hypothetical protein